MLRLVGSTHARGRGWSARRTSRVGTQRFRRPSFLLQGKLNQRRAVVIVAAAATDSPLRGCATRRAAGCGPSRLRVRAAGRARVAAVAAFAATATVAAAAAPSRAPPASLGVAPARRAQAVRRPVITTHARARAKAGRRGGAPSSAHRPHLGREAAHAHHGGVHHAVHAALHAAHRRAHHRPAEHPARPHHVAAAEHRRPAAHHLAHLRGSHHGSHRVVAGATATAHLAEAAAEHARTRGARRCHAAAAHAVASTPLVPPAPPAVVCASTPAARAAGARPPDISVAQPPLRGRRPRPRWRGGPRVFRGRGRVCPRPGRLVRPIRLAVRTRGVRVRGGCARVGSGGRALGRDSARSRLGAGVAWQRLCGRWFGCDERGRRARSGGWSALVLTLRLRASRRRRARAGRVWPRPRALCVPSAQLGVQGHDLPQQFVRDQVVDADAWLGTEQAARATVIATVVYQHRRHALRAD